MPKSKIKSRKDSLGRVLQPGETQRKVDGIYIYTYTDLYGNRRYCYSKDLLELRRKKERLLQESQAGINIYVSDHCTLNDAFDRYMSYKYQLRETTRSNYLYMYNHFVRESFGNRILSTIKYSDVKQYYVHLLQEDNIQINTLDSIHTLLHPTFEMAVRDDLIRKNPSKGVMAEIKKSSGKNKGIRHALTLEQQRAFIRYIESSPDYLHWLPIFKVLLGTGCRIGEVVGLRWQDVDLKRSMIDINHAVIYFSKGDKQCTFGVSKPKTEKGNRIIPMIPEVRETLQREYERQLREGFCTVELDGMTGFIFSNRFGNLFSPHVINLAINRIRNEHNAREQIVALREKREPVIIPHFSCHHLRHTFCSRLCETETNIKVIQEVMGHANVETTLDIYAEVNYAKKKESLENLAARLNVF